MSYYVRENGIVVKKDGEDPEAKYLKSYYLPGDDNVYHCDSTPEEKEYWGNQHALETEYNRIEYIKNAVGKEKDILNKVDLINKRSVKIFYRKWMQEDNIHWCTATPYISLNKKSIKFLGSSWQEFNMIDYGTYWAFSKNDFIPLPKKERTYYGQRFNY